MGSATRLRRGYVVPGIEGKAARVAASERGQRGRFNGAVGELRHGRCSREVAVERCGKQPRYNAWNSGALSSVGGIVFDA